MGMLPMATLCQSVITALPGLTGDVLIQDCCCIMWSLTHFCNAQLGSADTLPKKLSEAEEMSTSLQVYPMLSTYPILRL